MSEKKLLKVLSGEPTPVPPIWLMRQAGRYLPEYRATRATAGGFLNLVYNPALAAEVTLQPIRRYGFDAAILFSDILVVPDALGQAVSFHEGEGPRLDPIRSGADLTRLRIEATRPKFARIAETVARLRQDLPKETALIGFCGAPWTVATYMIAGEGSTDQQDARLFSYRENKAFSNLIDILVQSSVDYLSLQVEAGADALQIFDTWAGSLAPDEYAARVINPTCRIVKAVRDRHPGVPIIGFARGAHSSTGDYLSSSGIDAIGCDTSMSLEHMRRLARTGKAVQGNLDPLLLVTGGEAMERRAGELLDSMKGLPFVFNLGHGIVPQTPPENVARLVELVRDGGGYA